MWFQQDGVTCRTAWVDMTLLEETFPGRVVSRRDDISWPPRFCLWGCAKDRVYADKPSTLKHLKINQYVSKSVRKLPQKINACNIKKYFLCVLFTFIFENTKWITRYYTQKQK